MGDSLESYVRQFMISPEQAEENVAGFKRRFRKRTGSHGVPSGRPLTDKEIQKIAAAIIARYATYALAVGAVTAAPGVIPGWGTAVSMGGVVVDLGASVKIQVDMVLCLVTLYRESLSSEEKIQLALVIALASSAEQFAAGAGKQFVEKTATKLVFQYLSGPTLQLIKALFRKVAINFTQKAAARAIPFGIGVGLSGAANYALTGLVGRVSLRVLT